MGLAELDRCKHELLPGQCAICLGQYNRAGYSEHDFATVKERFAQAGVGDLLETIRKRLTKHGLGERPWVRALMFTPAVEGQGSRMIFTFAAHKDKPDRVWLYNGYTEAIREFYPGLRVERIREMLGSEGRSGQGRYLERDEVLSFLDAFDQLLLNN
jgi:predicted oxidoreductase